MKRRLLAVASAATLAMTMAACGSASTSSGDSGEDGPIKIALIPPTSGALAQFGTDAVNGWKTAVRLVNEDGGIDGRKVELVVKSTDADPATTLRVAKDAVTQDGAQFIGAVMTSPEHAALNAQLEGLGAMSFNSLGKDDALVGEQCSPYAVHVVQTSSMDINALASSLADLEGDKWAIQAVDYATGHGAAEKFKAAADKAGKKIVLEQFAPLNTTDFGSYITKIKSSGADAVFAVEYGADGVAFVQQAGQFNLDSQLKTVLGFNMVSEPLFKTLGDSIVGYYNNVGYDVAGDNELNKEFVEAYTEDHGSAPYYVPADNYLAAETLFAAIEKAGSSDPAEVAKAVGGLSFDSIVGNVTVRADDNQVLRDSYLGKVVQADSGLAFEVLSNTAPDVTTPEPDPACKF
ncbi:ABC transporter substrate-binding protein [Nocardioides nitrophenolicus]|uniref:ABC transporter substrate-binding protein n=1 Tax=Nocardioides nitrophenolicus TaxID=60489 RepID=UPI00195B3D3F|nr:ABC transporter substrate-binding protein [Nocardioides nitrophenolicus]MBM7517168.1 branched-chain amino acid transport system substrate-binding protein [Nocardioides nitrophenolicus]